MKPSWIVSLDCISAQQHKFTHKYGECFYWVEQQNEFAWKIYTVCFHVGQMLFAGNKYLLLKRITVQASISQPGQNLLGNSSLVFLILYGWASLLSGQVNNNRQVFVFSALQLSSGGEGEHVHEKSISTTIPIPVRLEKRA
jgi:hypothetical protein